MLNQIRVEHKSSNEEFNDLKKEIQNTKGKLKEKEDMFQNQI
jgi:hypothetical protein